MKKLLSKYINKIKTLKNISKIQEVPYSVSCLFNSILISLVSGLGALLLTSFPFLSYIKHIVNTSLNNLKLISKSLNVPISTLFDFNY